MNGDTWMSALGALRDRDVNPVAVVVLEAVESRRGAVGEGGAGAAGEHGGHVSALAFEEFARDERVDAPVYAVQAAAGDTVSDGASG
jgi:hypothetical protein